MSPIIIGIIGTLLLLVPVVLALWFRLRELESAVFKDVDFGTGFEERVNRIDELESNFDSLLGSFEK